MQVAVFQEVSNDLLSQSHFCDILSFQIWLKDKTPHDRKDYSTSINWPSSKYFLNQAKMRE